MEAVVLRNEAEVVWTIAFGAPGIPGVIAVVRGFVRPVLQSRLARTVATAALKIAQEPVPIAVNGIPGLNGGLVVMKVFALRLHLMLRPSLAEIAELKSEHVAVQMLAIGAHGAPGANALEKEVVLPGPWTKRLNQFLAEIAVRKRRNVAEPVRIAVVGMTGATGRM